jgi:uncharacterized cysteine cluster protein YcgN (CxxCxxCC family)
MKNWFYISLKHSCGHCCIIDKESKNKESNIEQITCKKRKVREADCNLRKERDADWVA